MSKVLAVKVHDLSEQDLRQAVLSYQDTDNFPVFVQAKKQLAFVEFPSIDHSTRCLEYINQGSIMTNNGKTVSAEMSTRQKVTLDGEYQKGSSNGPQFHTSNNIRSIVNNNPLAVFNTGSVNTGVKRQRDTLFGNNGFDSVPKRMPAIGITDHEVSPSPVLCIKSDLEYEDLHQFLTDLQTNHDLPAFVDLMHINGKTMSFVQYSNVQDSRTVLNHFAGAGYQTPGGVNMVAQFSKRKCIERNDLPAHIPKKDLGTPLHISNEAPPSKVLIVTLRPLTGKHMNVTAENMLLPFSRFGIVHKVIVWGKKDKTDLNALVQYSSLDYSQYARENMDGQTIGEFRAQLRYSERAEIDIANNTERMRDFCNPWLGNTNEVPPRQ